MCVLFACSDKGCYVYSDETELSDYIEQLLIDPNLRQIMSENAVKLFRTKFDGRRVYSDFSKHLEVVFNNYNKTLVALIK